MNKTKKLDISNRQKKLENARTELKKHFVCLDDIIDRIIDSIKMWYINPKIITRAPIICLWGLTGVGKTDMVRRLVKLLEFDDKFVEVNVYSVAHDDSKRIADHIYYDSDIDSDEQGIVLVDEIQWMRSKDANGEGMEVKNYSDFWEFLSDGIIKGGVDSIFNTVKRLQDTYFNMTSDEKKNTKKSKSQYNHDYSRKFDYYDYKTMIKLFKLNLTIEQASEMPLKDFIAMALKATKNKEIYEPIRFNNVLVFISGNLDDAYDFAKDSEDYNMDADYYHNISKETTVVDIKSTLIKTFRQEHVSRFGNTHIIYPTINKAGYYKIIGERCKNELNRISLETGLQVKFDDTMYDLIYSNGVFPIQGTRPLFSTINEIFNNVVSDCILHSIDKNCKSCYISYDKCKNIVDCMAYKVVSGDEKLGEHYQRKFVGQVDMIKEYEAGFKNEKTVYSIHEAGHCLLHCLLLGKAPQKTTVCTTNEYGGITMIGKFFRNNIVTKNVVKVCYGGMLAEELVFGKDFMSLGSGSDLRQITTTVSALIRTTGIYSDNLPSSEFSDEAVIRNIDMEPTNDMINKMSKELRKDALDILKKNQKILIELADKLFENMVMSSEEVVEILSKHGIFVECAKYNKTYSDDYVGMFHKYKKRF